MQDRNRDKQTEDTDPYRERWTRIRAGWQAGRERDWQCVVRNASSNILECRL